ncbi:hypothetical protein N431DRAFT_547110 [Stipitochalara longipes BDJ]|nr:hypothetical protein N431DRAFT_547110 [Stipitochalara longipes BDJ]
MHSFFGSNAVTTNTTTSAELQAGCTTAHNPNDFSSYWVPTLYYVDGTTYTEVPFSRFSAYYININSAEVAIPQNFKLVVSNSSATSQSDISPLSGVTWFCEGDASEIKDEAAFPTSTCSTHLQTLLLFHDCVHEETLESAYSGTQNWNTMFKAANRCSEGMKRMPQLRFSIRLACGTSYCSHGDFINGWLPEAAENMLNATSKTEFSEVTGPLGGDSDGAVCQNPVDADPDHGTDDYKTSLPMMQKRAIGRYDRRL